MGLPRSAEWRTRYSLIRKNVQPKTVHDKAQCFVFPGGDKMAVYLQPISSLSWSPPFKHLEQSHKGLCGTNDKAFHHPRRTMSWAGRSDCLR